MLPWVPYLNVNISGCYTTVLHLWNCTGIWLRQKHWTHQLNRAGNIYVSWSLFAQPRHCLPNQFIQMGQQQHQQGWGGEAKGFVCPSHGHWSLRAGLSARRHPQSALGLALLGLVAALDASPDALGEVRTNSSFCKHCCGWDESQRAKTFLHLPVYAPNYGSSTNENKW